MVTSTVTRLHVELAKLYVLCPNAPFASGLHTGSMAFPPKYYHGHVYFQVLVPTRPESGGRGRR
jgi:hypothetical protein